MRRSGASRRRLYLAGAGLLVIALVGGRWLAVETAERAWNRTFAGGDALIQARALGWLLQAFVLAAAIAWATGNLLAVYRAIGSVQMPRRLGDLEIVEAVPRRVLLYITIGVGVVLGILLSLGTGDWWRHALLAAAPPTFGVADHTLGRDVGYYLGVLPWRTTVQNRALLLTGGMTAVVALLYGMIGSLRIRRGRVRANAYARTHCGALLASVAVVIAWGAVLDPAEVIAGMHGTVDQAAIAARVPGAGVVASIAIVTAIVSLVWAWRDRPNMILAGWVALLLAMIAGYAVIPSVARASDDGDSAEFMAWRVTLERVAFGLADVVDPMPPPFATADAAVRSIPLWDAARVGRALGVPESAVALYGPAAWLIAPAASASQLRVAIETDTGLAVRELPYPDAAPIFGPGLQGYLVTSPDSAPAPTPATGVAVNGAWRRFALAWTFQAWGLLRGEANNRTLVLHRDVTDRLERLAPFARFGAPTPIVRGQALWWASWGYVAHDAFPLARPLPWRGRDVRFARPAVIGAVHAATGETHLWLTPGYDSLTATWARRFAPLIEPAGRLPHDVRTQLGYPGEMFDLSTAQLIRAAADSSGPERPGADWSVRPRRPFQLVAPNGTERWLGIAIESGALAPKQLVALCAGAVPPAGPRLHVWQPDEVIRLPGELVGSAQLRPGHLRIWPVDGAILTMQAQFLEPAAVTPPPAPRLAEVFVSVGTRGGRGPTPSAALRGGEAVVADTTLAARWQRARRLAGQADSALSVGDLEAFSRLWRALIRELAQPPSRR